MQVAGSGTITKARLLGSVLLLSCTCYIASSNAAESNGAATPLMAPTASLRTQTIGSHGALSSHGKLAQLSRGSASFGSQGISCVPYARQVSGIKVVGNAWLWWKNAVGHYARGDQPEPGSVLNFRSNGRMRLGHVAVVTKVVNPREIIVDHANWPSIVTRGNVARNIAVVDVSEANNWSAVRVELGHSGDFGAVYPTYGFIYNRPDSGIVTASVNRPAPLPDINPVPSDLRPLAERSWHTKEEVAELPTGSQRRTARPSGMRTAGSAP